MTQTDTRVGAWVEIIHRAPLRAENLVVDRELEFRERALLEIQRRHQHELGQALLRIEKLEEEKRLTPAERFGASSEANPQYALFDEAERFAEAPAQEDDETTPSTPDAAHTRTVAAAHHCRRTCPSSIRRCPPAGPAAATWCASARR